MRRRKTAVLLVLTALLAAGFLLWGNCSMQTTETALVSPALPPAFDGLRIVELADLHGRVFGRGSRRLLAAVRRAEPDLICIDGDLFDEHTDLAMLPPLLRGLCAIAPVYYVTGNHEWRVPGLRGILAQMRACGVTVLQDDWRVLRRDAAAMQRAHKRIVECFPISRVYQAHIPTYPSGHWLFGFASKKYHPVTDFNPTAWTLLGLSTRYYNAKLHRSAFSLPTYVEELLRDVEPQ